MVATWYTRIPTIPRHHHTIGHLPPTLSSQTTLCQEPKLSLRAAWWWLHERWGPPWRWQVWWWCWWRWLSPRLRRRATAARAWWWPSPHAWTSSRARPRNRGSPAAPCSLESSRPIPGASAWSWMAPRRPLASPSTRRGRWTSRESARSKHHRSASAQACQCCNPMQTIIKFYCPLYPSDMNTWLSDFRHPNSTGTGTFQLRSNRGGRGWGSCGCTFRWRHH